MSSNHTTLTRLAMLLAMIAALALAGCGGDDGVDQSVHDQALAAQAEAEQKAADEEAARMAAEQKAADEEAARLAAVQKAEADAAAAEEQRLKDVAAAAEEQRLKDEAAAAEEQRMKDEAAEEQRLKDVAAAAEEERRKAAAAAAKELMDVQMAADAAAMAAKTASDAAAMDAEAAMTATANIATLQTGAMSKMMAYEAKKAADGAMKAYMAAKMASETANADDATVVSATTARDMAVAEQANAEKYAMTADEKSMGAVKYAMSELMIDGKMKSVGESMVNAGAGMTTDMDDDGNKTITGRLEDMDPMHTVAMKHGQGGAQDDPNTPGNEAKTPMAHVAEMKVAIGRTLDTSDDMARLMLMTHYAGSKMVKVFDHAAAVVPDFSGTKAKITNDGTNDYGVNEGALTYKGMYYLATGQATDNDLVVADPTGTAPDLTNASDSVAADSDTMGVPEPVAVYSYMNAGDDGTPGNDDDVRHYVIVNSYTTTGGATTYNYRQVDVVVTLPQVPASPTADQDSRKQRDVSVMAELPDAKAYEHLHFGVWAGLGEANKKSAGDENGDQELDELGIGFVQSIGKGMTMTMPNQGMAKYEGDWAAAIQGASEGAITLQNGPARLTADLAKMTLEADLMGLAKLTGALDGNTFKGTKAAIATGDPHGLNSSGTFTGTFSGGFYGDKAVEAGGIFDFTSKDIADGAFRGAFGGHRDDLGAN